MVLGLLAKVARDYGFRALRDPFMPNVRRSDEVQDS